MSWIWQDLRFALRSLKKERQFAFVSILVLMLGIGAPTVVFSIIYNGLLHPFPYKDGDKLVQLFIQDTSQVGSWGRSWYTIPEILSFREQDHAFDDMIGCDNTDVLYKASGGTEEWDGVVVTPNTFSFLGVEPLLGHLITSEDLEPGSPAVFAMNYRLWIKRFDGDPKILGASFILNGESRTLVSIMPPRFGLCAGDVWMATSWKRSETGAGDGHGQKEYFGVIARLKPGVSEKLAAVALNMTVHQLSNFSPEDYPKKFTVTVHGLASDVVGDFKGTLFALSGAVAMVLVIACTNVANLLLARASAREKEMAIRASLGASHGRLVRQLLLEGFVLAAAGGGLGCLFAHVVLKLVASTIPPHQWIPDEAVISVSLPVLLFALVISILTTLLSALAPAMHAVRRDLQTPLRDAGVGVNTGFRYGKFRQGLVIGEIGLSLVLLVGTGLMMRSLLALMRVSLGFNPKNIVVMRIAFPQGPYETVEQKKVFFDAVLGRIASMPGVIAAAETISLPPYGGPQSDVDIVGLTHSDRWTVTLEACSESYFKTLELHLLHGRLLSETDVDSAREVAVINQTFAHTYFGKEDPLGHKVKFNRLDHLLQTPRHGYFEIIGVVSDSKNRGLREAPMPEAFVPYTISAFGDRGILVKTAVRPDSMLNSVRQEIWSVDHNVGVANAGTLEDYMRRFSYSQPEFGLVAVGAFSWAGLVLALSGVFSIMAYTVSRQTHEIGIRIALGAQRNTLLKMVFLRGLRLTGFGVVVGLLASICLGRLWSTQIWGVSTTDSWTIAAAVAIIVLTSLLACLSPALRAMKVDPNVVLRWD